MKIAVVFITVLALLFTSCATGQKAVEESSGSRSEAAGSAETLAGQIPVEVKEAILFADGSLDEYTTMEYDSSLTNIHKQNRFSASGTLLEQVEFAYADEKDWLSTKITRDVENRLKNRIVYQYNEQGQLWKETLTNKAGKAVSSFEYGYDGKGNRISRIVNSGAGVKLAETIYTVNDAGLVTASETRDGSGKKINSAENQYNTSGNLISQKVYNANGEVTTTINATWQDGLEIESEQTDANGVVQLRITNEYGPGPVLIRKKVEYLQGQSSQILQYEYTFKPGRHSS
jgi:hypothetical protein